MMAEDLNSGLPRTNPELAVRAGLELGASKLQVQRSNRSATLPEKTDLKLRLLLTLYEGGASVADSGATLTVFKS